MKWLRRLAWGPGAPSLWLMVLAACEAEPTELPPSRPVPSGLTCGDVPVDLRGRYAIGTEGQRSWRVAFALGELDCAALRAAYPGRPEPRGDGFVDVWLVQPLRTDGTPQPWEVRSAFIRDARGGRGLITRGAQLAGLEPAGDTIQLRALDLALQDRLQPDALYGHFGASTLTSCGRVKRPEAERPQPRLSLRIGGQSFTVRGASLALGEQGRRIVRLTEVPHRCSSALTEGYDFYVELTLAGEPPKLTLIALQGDAFPESPAASVPDAKLTVIEQKPDRELLSLAATVEAHGYRVELAGEIDAQRCVLR